MVLPFPSEVLVFLFFLSSSLFSVRWYLLLSAFVLFLNVVRASVHQGTDFSFANVCGKFRCLSVTLHVNCIVSSNFSINSPMSFVLSTVLSVSHLFLSCFPRRFQFENSPKSAGIFFYKIPCVVLSLCAAFLKICIFVLCCW